MFKFSLGSVGAFPIFDDPVSQKWPVVERNRPRFGALGLVFSVYRVVFDSQVFSLGSFGTFPNFDALVF